MSSYSHDLMEALDAFIEQRGERLLWMALAMRNGLSPDAFRERVQRGMSERQAAKTPRMTTAGRIDPNSANQRCRALGYKNGQPFYKLKKDLTEAGATFTEEDIYQILRERRREASKA